MNLALMALGAILLLPPEASAAPAVARGDAYAHFLRAKAALAADDLGRAMDEYAQARDLDPGSATAADDLLARLGTSAAASYVGYGE